LAGGSRTHREEPDADRFLRDSWVNERGWRRLGPLTMPPVRLRALFILVVLAHHRHGTPTAARTAQPVVDAFPDNSAPSYLLRDRDSIYGHGFRTRPWPNPFASDSSARSDASGRISDAPQQIGRGSGEGQRREGTW
jgi:hypothetical protein